MRRGILQVEDVLPDPARACIAVLAAGIALSGCGGNDEGNVSPAPALPPAAAAMPVADRDAALAAAAKALDDGRFPDAERIARALEDRAPDATSAELLGRTLSALKRPAEAADAYALAASRDPGNAALQHAAATVAEGAGRLDDALAGYGRAVELEPAAMQWRLFRANALLRADRVADAKADVDALLEIAPREAWTFGVRSEFLRRAGDASAAIDAARRARELSPDDLAFRLIESRALRAAGRASEAAARLSALDRETLASEAVADELSRAHAAAGDPTKAAEAWERAAAFHPESVRCAVEAARARLAAGDLLRARGWAETLRLMGATAEADEIDRGIREGAGAAAGDRGTPSTRAWGSPVDRSDRHRLNMRGPSHQTLAWLTHHEPLRS
jgi:predicted Zn-dependent protease